MVLRAVRQEFRSGRAVVDLIVATSCCVLLLTLVVLATGCAVSGQSRRDCGNNVKQMALGLQNYHDTYLYLPYGARNRSVKDVDGASWGSSWLTATLPFCEQVALFDKLVQAERSAPENDYQSTVVCSAANNVKPRYMICGASSLPQTQKFQGSMIVVPSYAGIMGSSLGTAQFKEQRVADGPYGGKAAGNGMLLINDSLTFAACTDGTANTIIVGETSNWYYDDKGAKRNATLSIADAGDGAKPEAGWIAGNNLDFIGKGLPGQGQTVDGQTAAIGADRVLNLIAVDHPINMNNRGGAKDTAPNWGSSGVGRCGFNNPLSSPHGAGAIVGFLDGHVMFLSSKSDTDLLYRLCSRDDGGVLPREY